MRKKEKTRSNIGIFVITLKFFEKLARWAPSENLETHQVNFTFKVTYLQISGNRNTDIIKGHILPPTNTLSIAVYLMFSTSNEAFKIVVLIHLCQ